MIQNYKIQLSLIDSQQLLHFIETKHLVPIIRNRYQFYKTPGIFPKFMHNSQSSQLLATLIILLPAYIKIDRVKNVVLIKITNLALRLLCNLLR